MVAAGGFHRLRHNTARPHILGADEAQPVEPLRVGEPGILFARHDGPPGVFLMFSFCSKRWNLYPSSRYARSA
jgi:hypothetical protein